MLSQLTVRHWLFIAVTVFFLVGSASAISLWDEGVFQSEEEQIEKLTKAIVPDSSVVFDRNGEKIGEYYNYYHVFVPFEQIPKRLIDAVLAIEDRKFFEHKGVNWKSMGRALWSVVSQGRFAQGGSTITMQLVKNYLLTREKKVSRKVREILLSYYVEKNLSKERILELYLNTMYMGHGAYGIGAASQTYFSKPIGELGTAEYALLAGLFQAPSAYDPHKNYDRAMKRQSVVLDAMKAGGYIDATEWQRAKSKKIETKPWSPLNQTVAPYFIAWIRDQVFEKLGDDIESINDRGYRIYTTLDKSLQLAANRSMERAESAFEQSEGRLRLKKGDRLETAFLVTSPIDGSVLVMNGGRDFKKSQFNRAVAAKRSPGSSFKPIVYSLAIESGMTWSDLVFVSPVNVAGYQPKNHDAETLSEVTLLKALARSLNTPVIEMAQKFGIEALLTRAKDMGVKSDMPREIGVALGGFSATVPDMARVYGTIASGGVSRDLWALQKVIDRDGKILFERTPAESVFEGGETRVFSEITASILRSGLQSVLTAGTGSSAQGVASFAAGKTGTSDESRDNWFCGFTRELVAISWVGTDGHSSLSKAASGASLALPLWLDFMQQLREIKPQEEWQTGEGLQSVSIDWDFGTPSDTGVSALFPSGKVPKVNQATEDMRTIHSQQGEFRGMKLDE